VPAGPRWEERTTGLKNAEGTVLLLPQRAQLVVRRERTWRARRGAGYMVRIFIREQAPSGKQQA
jgi:hypothetical protein